MRLRDILNDRAPEFEKRAPIHDRENSFVEQNLVELRDAGAYKAMIPETLGGGGASYTEMCHFLKDLAKSCPSTSLTLSMHQHLIAVQVFKYHQDKSSEPMLRMVAEKNFVLLSTGGGDWLASNGKAQKVDGGYRITCRKGFCSGAPLANVAAMSCAYDDGNAEHVLHFAVPMKSDGVTIIEDWDAMGMRGSGSHTVEFSDVFVPDEKIVLTRPRGEWHPIWEAVCTYAHPIFMASYMGVAEAIRDRSVELFKKRPTRDSRCVAKLGSMCNHIQVAKLAWQDIVSGAADFDTRPTTETAMRSLTGKSILSTHVRHAAQCAMEALGGYSYFRKVGIERLYRDLLAGEFHPLQAGKQEEALGNFMLSGNPLT